MIKYIVFLLVALMGPAAAQQVSNPAPLDMVDNTVSLKAFRPPSTSASLIRRGFYAAGDAPLFQYRYSNSPCTMNGGEGDDGAQVKAMDGKCWIAQILGDVDIRQWGAKADNVIDNAPIFMRALYAVAGKYCIIVPQDGDNLYAIRTTIVLPSGSNSCIKSVRQWARLSQPNGTNLTSMIKATGITGILLENIELDGNGINNPGGSGALIDFNDPAIIDVTLNNLYVHNSPAHGALIAGNGIFVNGGFYTNNGITPGTLFGGGMVIGSGGHSFTIQGANVNNNATYGIACAGTCYDGVINGNLVFNNGAGVYPNIADNITGYSADVHDVVISNNIVYGGGNNGIHFGGNRVTYSGNVVLLPAFHGIVHTSTKSYRTGTVTCNGTGAIVGVGTVWASQYPYNLFTADSLNITIDGVTSDVLRVYDDTNLQLYSSATCAAGSGKAYEMRGSVGSSNVSITGNTISGTVNPYAAIWVDQINGGVIANNVSVDGDGDGIAVTGGTKVSVTGNTMANKPNGAGIWVTANRYESAGTVSVTNGSSAVVGSGTSFTTGASTWYGSSVFMVAGDTTNYTVINVTDNTHLTLDRPFTGATAAGKAYAIATGGSDHSLVSGNLLTDNLNGVFAKASMYTTISGNDIGCTLAAATCDTHTGVLGSGYVQFGDAILANNFPRMKFWQAVDNVNNSIGPNARDQTPLGPILPKNCTLQVSGAMYNNAGAFAICP